MKAAPAVASLVLLALLAGCGDKAPTPIFFPVVADNPLDADQTFHLEVTRDGTGEVVLNVTLVVPALTSLTVGWINTTSGEFSASARAGVHGMLLGPGQDLDASVASWHFQLNADRIRQFTLEPGQV